jgi:hypothetical protein
MIDGLSTSQKAQYLVLTSDIGGYAGESELFPTPTG